VLGHSGSREGVRGSWYRPTVPNPTALAAERDRGAGLREGTVQFWTWLAMPFSARRGREGPQLSGSRRETQPRILLSSASERVRGVMPITELGATL